MRGIKGVRSNSLNNVLKCEHKGKIEEKEGGNGTI
jgi:hypothetical protein